MSLQFALLNASHEKEPARRNFRRELAVEFTEFDVREGEIPSTASFDAAVLTGSPASVRADEPWLRDLKEWLAEAIEDGMPLLGVCFGQQVLAEVLGGRVEHMGEYELGYHMIRHDTDSRLFEGVDEWFTAFTAHSDEVCELPPGAEPIAENNFSVHGFRKRHVFAVQFHPAFDMETAKTVLEYKDVPEKRIDHVVDEITEENYSSAREATQLFENFCDYVRERRAEGRPSLAA
ncbi:MAG TPA: type 1 glutamine amidotransferase [Halococcus sp.]|nr:type 1 glutamine amidotransferase [Halococcus sp.]